MAVLLIFLRKEEFMLTITGKIGKAISRACVLHGGQTRKGDGSPYISHPFSVALILSRYTQDENVICAGLLHDTLEDVEGYTFQDLNNEFGDEVAIIVRGVTEEKEPASKVEKKATWNKRKIAYLENLVKGSKESLMVSCADKIHNLQSILEAYEIQGEELWKKFNGGKTKSLWFYGKVVMVAKAHLENDIVQELEEIYRKALIRLEP
jgi:(p)ppGpp synthase/HD superfamily hydrolase